MISTPGARFASRALARMTAATILLVWGCASEGSGSGATGPAHVAVRIAIAGEGGSVRSADPAFECRAASCTEQIVRGSPLYLVAVPEAQATFQGWGGACSGSGACELLADRDLEVTAAFSRAAAAMLTVRRTGSGSGRTVS